MQAATFDALVQTCLMSDFKHRMLYVFVRVAQMDPATRLEMGIDDEDAAVVQVLFDAQQPAEPGLTFEQVRKVADEHNPDWTLCVVGTVQNADGSLPGEEQAQSLLTIMREKVLTGDVDDYTVVDKTGRNVIAEPDEDEAETQQPTIN